MAGSVGGETIEATMGRFFNAEELAAREVPELYRQAAEFHDKNSSIINHPMSLVARLTLDEPSGGLYNERFLVNGMSKRTIWLGIDTAKPDEAYGFVISGFGNRGMMHRCDVTVRPNGTQSTMLYTLDGQNSLLRKHEIAGLTAQVTVHRIVDFLLTHPETQGVIKDIRDDNTKVVSRAAKLLAKEAEGAKLSSEEKKALKVVSGRGLLPGSWQPMNNKVPRIA